MSPREAGAVRRRRGVRAYCAAVLAWTAAFMAALVLLPPGAHTIAAAHADSSSVTVPGPAVWIPSTQTYGANGAVTVSQTTNLVDQMVHVSWTGFTPSSGQFVTFTNLNVLYPVAVYECRGTNPKITDCYGTTHYGQKAAAGFAQPNDGAGLAAPDFPNNAVPAVTRSDGTGSADIEVYTANQSPSLGCDAANPCSIVVEPNYGGDSTGIDSTTSPPAPNCADHGVDRHPPYMATFNGFLQVDPNQNGTGEMCAWNNHVTIPLSFAPVAGACPASAAGVSAEGMPMLDRALAQWTVGACLNSADPVTLQYSSDITEPESRSDFLQGRAGADMAFTSLPADPAASSAHPYTYVPLGNTGIVIAFFIDDARTHLPITGVKLNARLIAKLLTQSYDVEHISTSKIDIPSVAGNPTCLFSDPEFLALNAQTGVTWPNCAGNAISSLPIVTGGTTDLVTELTTWIMSDPDAEAFLAGTPDPWGMHVDSFYQTSKYPYPINSFVSQDGSGPAGELGTGLPFPTDPNAADHDGAHMKGYEWNPLQAGLDDVARHMLQANPTCIVWQYDAFNGIHDKCTAQLVGGRDVIAVMDAGRAAAFNMPTAALANGSGAYVPPNASSMKSAALDYVTDPKTGTQSLPWGSAHTGYSGDTNAYALTVPTYAMAPTSGVPAAKATTIADLLSAVTDSRSGQLSGTQPGELAPGFTANTPAQAAQAGAAIGRIRAGAGPNGGPTTVTATGPATGKPTTSGNEVITPVTVTKNGTPSVSYSTSTLGGNGGANGGADAADGASGSSKGAAGASGSSGPTRNLSGSTTAAAVGSATADKAGVGRLILPILLIIGLVLVAAGPAALVLSSGGVSTKLRALWPQAKRRFGR
ncbi:hypothetical protein KGQ19_08145 [Catenulispora sp. NL8]|uniref:PBP domain-containing protein n=1 Tax=Catenulispora pinistramenti TaxID=2705254 RepID=A0ABS5KLB8_9ACTN|nr:hypothetical protein [Catenulispora pinistramenti]MBS2546838.1 hypothetical protein [Catenulispora pinistramenti]